MKNKLQTISNLQKIAKEIALLILDISYKAKTGHVGSALSISDILTVLYFSKMRISPNTLEATTRDRFILSKGHAAAALYAVLYKKGILTKKKLNSFGQDRGGLCEHPEIKERGIEMTTGSLGHGLAFGIGIAYGLKITNLKARVYVLISDGESGEGSTWEAALLASRLKLNNLIVILDYNKWQCFGQTDEVTNLKPLKEKWKAFGWITKEINGHNISECLNVFSRLPLAKDKPHIIIAHTVSGHNISLIENKLIGHYKIFNEDEYQKARLELSKL